MKQYKTILLKWTITIVLAYAINKQGTPYSAVGFIWVMAWLEVLGFLLGQTITALNLTNKALYLYIKADIQGSMEELLTNLGSCDGDEGGGEES